MELMTDLIKMNVSSFEQGYLTKFLNLTCNRIGNHCTYHFSTCMWSRSAVD